MSVSISEILAGAKAHAVPLAGECAGYLVLAAADQAVAAPRRIGPAEVRLFDDGTVRVEGSRAAAETDSEADLRALLDALLVRASSATPALLRASRRAPGRGIAALVREIETALIPVNRSAAHRALARLERETERARHAGRIDATAVAEAAREPSPKAPEPAPPPVVARPEPPVEEPRADEIPSLLAPPVEPAASVETIAALAAEIETRPEPIVARRSAPSPPLPSAKTPSPPPFPVSGRSSPLPPVAVRTPSPAFPVSEAQPTTPFFGTVVQSHVDDDMDIEIVVDDELLDDELTSVLVRSEPLEVSAMTASPLPVQATESPEAAASPDGAEAPDPTDPCPPAIDEELAPETSAEPTLAEASDPERPTLLADAAESPELVASAADAPASELPEVVELVASEPPAPEVPELAELVVGAAEPAEAAERLPLEIESVPAVLETVRLPPVVSSPAVEAFAVEEAPREPVVAEANDAEPAVAQVESVPVPIETAPLPLVVVSPAVEGVTLEATAFEAPADPNVDETLALALAIDPAPAAATPVPRLAMPKPRVSDVDDLLERMTQENPDNGELRATLKGLAGLDPTPPPPKI